MVKQYSRNPLFWKSIGKFWMLIIFFGILLFALQGIIPKLYKTIFDTLKWETHIPFFFLIICFGILIGNTVRIAYKLKTVEWKTWDAFIIAYSLYYGQTLEFVKVDSLESFWNLLENSPVFTFICLASLYLIIKSILGVITLVNALPKKARNNNSNQQDQDLSLDCINGFDNITDLNKLRELDKLGRFDHAQQISHVINNIKPEKSFAIGINGEWGSGKTSFIHLIRRINQIEYPKYCKFITFNPWYFTGTEKVLIKFHETLLSEVGHFSLSLRNELDRYFKLICAAEKSLWKTNFLQFFQQKPDFQSQLEKLKSHFKKLPQKILIIIDDMDRLQKDEVLVLFRTMRLIADFPNVIYLVGYDPDYIATILGEKSEENKSSFMEKIFQLEFDLPDPLPSDLKNFWKIKLQKYTSNINSTLQDDFVNLIVDNEITTNLRDIKRFLNQIALTSSLPEIKKNTYFPQFFLLELIYYSNPDVYYKIKASQTLDITEKIEAITQKIIEQIKKISSYSEQSITKKEHFGKYFYKRLDKELDINYEAVVSMFNDPNYETQIETLYTQNKKQFIDCIIDYTNDKNQLNSAIDLNFTKEYFNRIFHLLEHSYSKDQLDTDFFTKKHNYSCIKLFSGLASVWKLFTNDSAQQQKLKEYLEDKTLFNSYSFILLNLAQQENLLKTTFDFNSLFLRKIESYHNTWDHDIEPLLVDLFIYQIFLKSIDNNKALLWLGNNDIKNTLLQRSETIAAKIDEINESDNSINIISFFGSTKALLKLNNQRNKGIFKMLDVQNSHYPILHKNNTTQFIHSFKYDRYNYLLKLPKEIICLDIFDEDTDDLLFKLDFSNQYLEGFGDDTTDLKRNFELPQDLLTKAYLDLYRHEDGVYFQLVTNPFERKPNTFDNYTIASNPYFKIRISIMSKNKENYSLQRQIINLRNIDAIQNLKLNPSNIYP